MKDEEYEFVQAIVALMADARGSGMSSDDLKVWFEGLMRLAVPCDGSLPDLSSVLWDAKVELKRMEAEKKRHE